MKFQRSAGLWLFIRLSAILAVFVVTSITVEVPIGGAQDSVVHQSIPTQKAPRRKASIRQSSPSTCGPAALATLFTVYFDDPTTEDEMLKLTGTDKHTVSKLNQLAAACSTKSDYKAEGRRWKLSRLLREMDSSDIPFVAHLKAPTEHYVLVVGRVNDFFLLFDPDRGDVTVHQTDFIRRWSGNVLVVKSLRPVDASLVSDRKRSAERRLRILSRANSSMSATGF
jgi:predicted double-glycine peptidase